MNALDLHCPRCGGAMGLVDGELTCVRGSMPLSEAMLAALTRIAESEPQDVDPLRIRWGGEWHCPADGERMVEADARMQCPSCGRALPSLVIHDLTEFHPHARVRRSR